MNSMVEIKDYLKANAITIRNIRKAFKKSASDLNKNGQHYTYETYSLLNDLEKLVYDYRHTHIAYSELRGKTRDQIEKPRETNLPDESYIERIKQEIISHESEQTLCASA